MKRIYNGQVVEVNKNIITLRLSKEIDFKIIESGCINAAIKFQDSRIITDEQRKKIFALIGDIADWCSGDKEYTRSVLRDDFCFLHEQEAFSLSDVDCTTASMYISYLVEFCIYHGVPCKRPLVDNCEDIAHMMYCCLLYKRCAVCGINSVFHHCTGSRSGMGRKSLEIPIVGLFGMALCNEHHTEIHNDAEQVFYDRYFVMPCKVTKRIAKVYPHYG